MPKLLSPEQVKRNLAELEFNWQLKADKLVIEVETASFNDALWLLNKAGQAAEKLNHHPDLTIHDYKFVTITTTTHSVGGLTAQDFQLAEQIDAIISRTAR